jgi:hypothetical protein
MRWIHGEGVVLMRVDVFPVGVDGQPQRVYLFRPALWQFSA